MIRGNDPILLTPGPLTTSLRTKQAMLSDWGSWDAAFNSITASIRCDTVDIINGGDDYTCVPLQGSGTFSVEAAIGTLVPRDGKVLVPNNGAYCARIVRICSMNRAVVISRSRKINRLRPQSSMPRLWHVAGTARA
jgi:2-aminoethylphosphonate-pyruvate transaminase